MAAIEYAGAALTSSACESMFNGIKFWLSRQVPCRQQFTEYIEKNGGQLVSGEQDATIKIVDHARKHNPYDSFSYEFITKSVKQGALDDLEKHRVGPRQQRHSLPGSGLVPASSTKRPYTVDDDCILWDWMTKHLATGGTDGGNVVYQDIAAQYPHHTFQSWRDHWLNKLKGRPRPTPQNVDHQATPSSSAIENITQTLPETDDPGRGGEDHHTEVQSAPLAQEPKTMGSGLEFHAPTQSTQGGDITGSQILERRVSDNGEQHEKTIAVTASDQLALVEQGHLIEQIDPELSKEAWASWASDEKNSHHQPETWEAIWEQLARPIWLENQGSRSVTAEDSSEHPTQPESAAIKFEADFSSVPIDIDPRQSPSQRAKANSSKRLAASRPSDRDAQRAITSLQSEVTPQSSPKSKRPVLPLGELDAPMRPRPKEPHQRQRANDRPSSPQAGSQDEVSRQLARVINSPGAQLSTQTISREHSPSIDLNVPERSIDLVEITSQESSVLSDEEYETAALPTNGDVHSSMFSTTTPGNTAQSAFPSTPPDREVIAPDSSQISTTPPGNTAAPRPASPNHQSPGTQRSGGRPQQSHTSPEPSAEPPAESPRDATSEEGEGQVQDQDLDRALNDWIDGHLADGRALDDVLVAIRSASMDTRLADEALYCLHQTGRLPLKRRGIWTAEDDDDLRASSSYSPSSTTGARRVRRLIDKHGNAYLAERVRFLRNVAADEGEGDA